ncbi:hypothetical protein [Piscirickettsia salmonis]|nr:hypothetical protein [Piscirickettsia salmonis]
MMQNRRAKRDDYKPSAVRVTQRYVPCLALHGSQRMRCFGLLLKC